MERTSTEFEEDPQLKEEPLRRIRKLDIPSQELQEKELQELYESLPRFGPYYNEEEDHHLLMTLKEAAWRHVLLRSPTSEQETTKIYMSAIQKVGSQARNAYPEDCECLSGRRFKTMIETTEKYMSVIQKVGGQARNAYPEDCEDSETLYSHRFITMMVKDGCFTLQIALFLLGGLAHLNYPRDHIIFGEHRNIRQVREWGRSLFFMGNQVPEVVLKELMKQSFFQQVRSARRWKRPSDSIGRALYDLLFAPQDRRTNLFQGLRFVRPKSCLTKQQQQQPLDLLHRLQLLVIGAGGREHAEDGYESEGDLEDNINFKSIRRAAKLRRAGIHFRNTTEGTGIRGIKFTATVFRAVLELPTLEVGDDTEMLFRHLQHYEITQPLLRNKREVRSYIQFMSELVRKSSDVNLLCAKGIIRANWKERQKIPAMLSRLARYDSTPGYSTYEFHILRNRIEDYTPKLWERLRNLLSVVVLLTLLQTVYTVLGYYKN